MGVLNLVYLNPPRVESRRGNNQNAYNDLKVKNTAVVNADVPLNNARIARNNLLYKDSVGLVDTTTSIKTYIKSVYEASSPQFKAISKLEFKKMPI